MRAPQFFAALITLIALLSPMTSWSDDGAKYDFNSSGEVKPEFKKGIQFKEATDKEKEKKMDLVKDAETSGLYIAPVGYPKSEIYFSYNPGVDGFTNTLSGTRAYNYGGTNLTGMSAGFVYNPSIENYLTLDLTYESISLPAFSDTGAGLLVAASNADMLDVAVGFNFCQVYESTYHRLCPGVELDYDSFPTLGFPASSNSQINLQTVHDMTLGVNLAYTHRLGQSVQFLSKIAYNYGLDLGQSSSLGTKSDQKFAGRLGIEKSIASNWYLNLVLGLDYRTATLQSALDSWKIEALTYNARLGFRYEL